MKIPSCIKEGHYNSGNLTITPIHLEKDKTKVEFHKHETGHNMFCYGGEIMIRTQDPSCDCKREKVISAGEHVWIPAGVLHSAIAVTDEAFGACVFVKEEFDFQVEKEKNGWDELGQFNIEK